MHAPAKLVLAKLRTKSSMALLHLLLTMDVFLLDECGKLSAQQFALVDIILRHARNSALPFGGVLIFGTFDHRQLGAIDGLPFLLSTHILTDFTLVRLEHSVRAAGDKILQVSEFWWTFHIDLDICVCPIIQAEHAHRVSGRWW